jgi:energy-coupling factor transporter ATP-binding protein EcfA2
MQSQLPHLFEEYIEHVNHIFPSVHRIQAVALEGQNAFAIRAWLAPASARRFDLSIPLLQMGTGVGQVLAILYVAMSSLEPITIGIDEPNSFLHPKAVRSLLQILNALPIKHQYIITTHSPEVIRAAEQNGIVVVINENGISRTQRLDPSNIDDIKESLASIGARLSDVYGADKILWVEGETEEIAFPKIAQRLRGIDTVGVSILKVNATGDFERKKPGRARMIFNTYKKLSSSNSLIPPAIGFIFDREGRSEREIEHLIRESGGSVMFTDRRCYENYLLRPNAIAKVLSNSLQDNVDVERVRAWILENGNSNAYINGSSEIIEGQYLWDSLDWLKRVDAPKLLADLFSSLSENTVEYRKIKHSIEITDVIMIDEFEQLDPIAELIKQRLLQYDAAST